MQEGRRRWFVAAFASLFAGVTRTEAQVFTYQYSASFFRPLGPPWYRAALAIEAGKLIDLADLKTVTPDIDHRVMPSELTLLQFAWEKGNVAAIDQVISAGADWRAKLGTEKPRSLQDLLYEVQVSEDRPKALATLGILLAHGLDANQRDPEGDPILREAIVARNEDVERGLVEAGADPWATGAGLGHTTCVEVALENGAFDFLHWLIERGSFDRRAPGQVEAILSYLAKQPRDFAPDLISNQDLAAAIVERTGLQPDPAVQSLLREHSHRG